MLVTHSITGMTELQEMFYEKGLSTLGNCCIINRNHYDLRKGDADK